MTRRVAEKGTLERGLGWFSVGLGLAQLASPCGVASLAGMGSRDERIMRGLGLRELASGVGILARRRPAGFLWARTLGDMMDLALLGREWNARRADRQRLGIALAAVGGVAILDLMASLRTSRRPALEAVSVTRLITIGRPPAEVHAAWRSKGGLPEFLAAHLEDVEILDERQGEMASWRSRPGARIPHVGIVRFTPAPGDRGTEVRVDLHYHPPLGKLGAAAAKLVGKDPGHQIGRDLRHLKQLIEVGEILHSDASVHRGMHPARPSRKPPELPEQREERRPS